MRERVPLVLSIAALVIAVLGWTSAGQATHRRLGRACRRGPEFAFEVRIRQVVRLSRPFTIASDVSGSSSLRLPSLKSLLW